MSKIMRNVSHNLTGSFHISSLAVFDSLNDVGVVSERCRWDVSAAVGTGASEGTGGAKSAPVVDYTGAPALLRAERQREIIQRCVLLNQPTRLSRKILATIQVSLELLRHDVIRMQQQASLFRGCRYVVFNEISWCDGQ